MLTMLTHFHLKDFAPGFVLKKNREEMGKFILDHWSAFRIDLLQKKDLGEQG